MAAKAILLAIAGSIVLSERGVRAAGSCRDGRDGMGYAGACCQEPFGTCRIAACENYEEVHYAHMKPLIRNFGCGGAENCCLGGNDNAGQIWCETCSTERPVTAPPTTTPATAPPTTTPARLRPANVTTTACSGPDCTAAGKSRVARMLQQHFFP
mmetsp:Transcript_92584/g.262086  ORF Transcript_92584/g.262086 Transcript_92584/m.262086 type:complete len:155 (-) Transcript_92584:155-619(-)